MYVKELPNLIVQRQLKKRHKSTEAAPSTANHKQLALAAALKRALRIGFSIGDKVIFKKPRRNPIVGTITDVELDDTRVVFEGNTPVPITVAYMDKKGSMVEVLTAPNRIRKHYV